MNRTGNVKTVIDIEHRQDLNEKYPFSLSFKTNRTAIREQVKLELIKSQLSVNTLSSSCSSSRDVNKATEYKAKAMANVLLLLLHRAY